MYRTLLVILFLLPRILNAKASDSSSTMPLTVAEAHNWLLRDLPDSVLTRMRNGAESEMIEYHMGLGTWIRNHWGLWAKSSGLAHYFDSLGLSNPDGMSQVLLETFWCRLNNQPLLLDERIQRAIHDQWLLDHSRSLSDSTCPLDHSRFRISGVMEKLGPPYRYWTLLQCSKHRHLWVFEAGGTLYKPDKSLLDEIRSRKWLPLYPRPTAAKPVPVPDVPVSK